MKKLAISSFFWQLKPIIQTLSLLNFWKEYPEIKSISVSCNYTYDDADAYFPSFSVTNIEFVSPDAEKCLAQKLFPDLAVNKSKSEIEGYEWDEAIGFTENVILDPEDNTYDGKRLPFLLLKPGTWTNYKRLLRDRVVFALSVHPPKIDEALAGDIIGCRQALEDYMQVPVVLEVMPSSNYWLSHNSLIDVPLLLDISHINIWHRGVPAQVAATFAALLPQASAIHVSHNNGRNDSRDLIPSGIWFENLIDTWAATMLITYESLPQAWGNYERLDKRS